MPTTARHGYEVISVSLPRDLVARANALIPKTRRSRVISEVLGRFLDSIERKRLERDYMRYYAHRPAKEAREERDLLAEWELSDAEAWEILEKEEARGRRAAR
jgi:metal-responsive CopG/Arc/MetJ family transcriptional regulator